MAWKAGETVIITQEGVNRVGVILDKFLVSKQTMYDVLDLNHGAYLTTNRKPSFSDIQQLFTYVAKNPTAHSIESIFYLLLHPIVLGATNPSIENRLMSDTIYEFLDPGIL